MSDEARLYEIIKQTHETGMVTGLGAGTAGLLVALYLPIVTGLGHSWSVFTGMVVMFVIAIIATSRFRQGAAEAALQDGDLR